MTATRTCRCAISTSTAITATARRSRPLEQRQAAAGAEQSEWERDFSLDYVIQGGTFKGLGVAWRNGKSHSEAARNGDQNRLIINYTLPLF